MGGARKIQSSPTLDSGAVEAIRRRVHQEAGQIEKESPEERRRKLDRRLYESYAINSARMCVFREEVLRRLKSENKDTRMAALRKINERDALLEIVMDGKEGCIPSGFSRDLKAAAAEKLRGMAAEKDIIAWIVLNNHAGTTAWQNEAFGKIMQMIREGSGWRRQVTFGANERAIMEALKWCERHRKLMGPPVREHAQPRQAEPAVNRAGQQELRKYYEMPQESVEPAENAELREKFRLFFGAVKMVHGWQMQCVR